MSFAVLYLPLVAEFGGSRGEVAVAQSVSLLLGGFTGPLVGAAFDRFGPRRLFQGSAVLAAAALVVASRVTSLPLLVLTYGLWGGLALAPLGSQTNMTVAAFWYPSARGRAIAVVDLGTAVGAVCFLLIGQALATALGWRATLLVWATLLVLVVVPLNAFQRLPEGPTRGLPEGPTRGSPVGAAVERDGSTGPRPGTTLADALGVGCLAALALTGASWWLVLYVVLYGMAQGSSGIVASARAADLFAGPSFGAIWGWLTLAVGPGEALGAWLGGKVFDVWGSYFPAFGFVWLTLAAGVVSMWRVRPAPRDPGSARVR